MSTERVLDTTPHPRILSVLGEIEFQPWQCIAELIDNSLDGFLDAQRSGNPIKDPVVHVAFGRETVDVVDNGPGMSIDRLESAVSAGWTSREGFESLGLYGIGFNIATARLGDRTTILTTQKGDKNWYGVVIDIAAAKNYKQNEKHNGFLRQLEVRPKANPEDSGTRVTIENVKDDWRPNFTRDPWIRTNIREKLARIYGSMLRDVGAEPLHFSLHVNNRKVSAWEHCVWPEDMRVYRKSEGDVSPVIHIDQSFGTRYYSPSTRQFIPSVEGLSPKDYIEVKERVYGWIGIQRYASQNDYGIDIIRNGRKIEVACKDVFEWESADGERELEYPIDDVRSGGRIVGELHLDHGYVHYTKHKFEREHASWSQLLLALRKKEPLTNRKRHGFDDVNSSPLGKLFRTFRRNSPQTGGGQKWSDILFVRDNNKTTQWAKEYRKKDPEYLNIEPWKKALADSDVDPASSGADAGADPIIQPPSGQPTPGTDNNPNAPATPTPAPAPVLARKPLPTHNIHITGIGPSGRSYTFEAYEVGEGQKDLFPWPWKTKATSRGIYEVEIDTQNSVFNSTTLGIRDAILADAAYIIVTEEYAATASETLCYGDILARLREQFGTAASLSPTVIQEEVGVIRKKVSARLADKYSALDGNPILSCLSDDEVKNIKIAQARGPVGKHLFSHLNISHFAAVLQKNPKALFDAGCFAHPWVPNEMQDNPQILEEYQQGILRELRFPLMLLGDVENAIYRDIPKQKLFLVKACVNLINSCLA